MDALVPAFVVALLCELGDRTQLLAALLGGRYRAPAAVLAGIGIACAVNMAAAVAAGIAAAALVDHRAIRMLVGVALFLAGIGGLFGVKPPPPVAGWRLGAILSSAGAYLILQFGERAQFATMAIAAGGTAPWLAGIGAAAGTIVADVPAVALGVGWERAAPLRAIRVAIGVALIVAGFGIAGSIAGIV